MSSGRGNQTFIDALDMNTQVTFLSESIEYSDLANGIKWERQVNMTLWIETLEPT